MARVIALCSVCLLLLESTSSLKCRTGVQQADDQFRKVAQICKKRYTDDDNYSDNSSSNQDYSDESSSTDAFDIKFFMNSGNKSPNMRSGKSQNRNRGSDQRNGNNQRYSFNYTDGNWKNAQYQNHGSNNRDLSYSDGSIRSGYDQIYNSNSEKNDKEWKKVCVVQCIFNELNMVDQRGFPEQNSVIQQMTYNIRNPELQDFIEEAIIECFHYLSSDMRQNKCYFSQNLLICLANKGKERCEDWEN